MPDDGDGDGTANDGGKCSKRRKTAAAANDGGAANLAMLAAAAQLAARNKEVRPMMGQTTKSVDKLTCCQA